MLVRTQQLLLLISNFTFSKFKLFFFFFNPVYMKFLKVLMLPCTFSMVLQGYCCKFRSDTSQKAYNIILIEFISSMYTN